MTAYDLAYCPTCKESYSRNGGDTCPVCPNITQHGAILEKQVHEAIVALTPTVKFNEPESLGKTGRKLAYPMIVHGVEIQYIRQHKNAKKPNAYYYDGHWHSILELWFYVAWQKTGLPMPTPEYKFHPTRRWKLDFAWQAEMICVEMEGGAHSRGRHTRGVGFKNDIEKYNQATALGWRLYRFADTKQAHIDFMKARFEDLSGMEIAA